MNRQSTRPTARFSILFPLCLCWLACSIAVGAQTQGGTGNNPTAGRGGGAVSHSIRGKIFLPSGTLPEQRIRVVLEITTGGIVQEVFSDSVGNFEFRSVGNGSYRVSVPSDLRTYETAQEAVEIYGNFSRTFAVQVYLRDKNSDNTFKPKDKMISVADLQEVPKAAKKSYEQGLKRSKEGKLEEAVAQFQEAVKIFPDYLNALNKLGEQFAQMQQPAEAQAMFERALAVNNKYSLAHINLGMLLVGQQRFAAAVAHLETANRYDDGYPMAHLNLSIALMSEEPPDFDRAEKEINRALQLGGKNIAYARMYLFNLNLRRKDYSKAAEQLEAYLKDAPDAPDAERVRETLKNVKKAMAQQAGAAKP